MLGWGRIRRKVFVFYYIIDLFFKFIFWKRLGFLDGIRGSRVFCVLLVFRIIVDCFFIVLGVAFFVSRGVVWVFVFLGG